MPSPDRSAPRYPVPWIATYLVTGLILIVGSFAVALYLERPSSKFDYDDPDLRFLETIVLSDNPRQGDFSKLNGGDWQALCLTGLNGDVGAALAAAGIGNNVAQAITSAAEDHRDQIAETEFLLVYADSSGVAKALHHPHGFAFARRGAALCTSKDSPTLALPVPPQ